MVKQQPKTLKLQLSTTSKTSQYWLLWTMFFLLLVFVLESGWMKNSTWNLKMSLKKKRCVLEIIMFIFSGSISYTLRRVAVFGFSGSSHWDWWIFHANHKHTTYTPAKPRLCQDDVRHRVFLDKLDRWLSVSSSAPSRHLEMDRSYRLSKRDLSSLGIRWRTPKVIFRFLLFLSYLAPALFWSLKRNTSWVVFFTFSWGWECHEKRCLCDLKTELDFHEQPSLKADGVALKR